MIIMLLLWAPLNVKILLLGHCLVGRTTSAAFSAKSYLIALKTTAPISYSATVTHRMKAVSTVTTGPDDDLSGNTSIMQSASSRWRIVDPDSYENVVCSPFCRPMRDENSQSTASATANPWSESAYQSALELHDRIKECTDPYISSMLTSAIHDLDMAYRLYGPFSIVGSYNGGKDAVVIFHLMRAVHAKFCHDLKIHNDKNNKQRNEQFMIPRPRVIYFQHRDEFPEVLSLLHETVESYDAEMLAFKESVSFAQGLKYLVEKNYPPGIDGLSYYGSDIPIPPPHPLAFVLGTRKDDPNAGSQGIFAPSSHYMPPFLRINPILNWTYGHVWHFLRLFDLPYCSLYDKGYTSLGTVKDTLPCPALKKDAEKNKFNSADGTGDYWPAYMLKDWNLERSGRISISEKLLTEQNSKHENEVVVTHAVTLSQTSSTVSLSEATVLTQNGDSSNQIILNDNTDSNHETELFYHPPKVALIVIGDELLKGMTPDSNIFSAARALRSNNVSLTRVSIISDDSQVIVNEIQRVLKTVDAVITSGGVGPTHDDVTIKSVAEALGLEMELHYEMAKLLLEKMGNDFKVGDRTLLLDGSDGEDPEALFSRLPEGLRKMATIPSTSVLQYLSQERDKDEWPVLQCDKVYILPGVPHYFQTKIQQLAVYISSMAGLRGSSLRQLSTQNNFETQQFHCAYRILLSLEENAIVPELNATVQAHPHVTFGSYPLIDHPKYKTIITLEGKMYKNRCTIRSDAQTLRFSSESVDGMSKDDNDNTVENRGFGPSLHFSVTEIEENVKMALDDLKLRLPVGGIVKVDMCDCLNADV